MKKIYGQLTTLKVLFANLKSSLTRVLLFTSLLISISVSSLAQTPDNLGTDIISGSYTSYTTVAVGGFKQVRLQATSSASTGVRKWEFYSCNSSCYSNNWRPYASGLTLSGYNTFISPVGGTASALYNTGFGGQTGQLPAVTSGSYYTFNISNTSGANNNMSVLQTTYSPVTINSVSNTTPTSSNSGVAVTVTTSAAPSAGENVFVRYSTSSSFTSSTLAQVTFTGTTGVAVIPCQTVGTVYYYVYSSPKTLAQINSDVTTYLQGAHDMATLNVNNNAGANYSYSQVTGTASQFNGVYVVPSSCYASLSAFVTALNAGSVTGAVTCYVDATAAAYTETAPVGGISITATGTSTNTITIKRQGGNTATIQAFTPQASGTLTDAVIKIVGGDYITIDGLTIQENASNATTTSASNNMTEMGIGLFLTTATNGAQNNTIQNCTISMGSTYQNAMGIFSTSSSSTTNGALAASATTGTNSNNKIYSNTISNVAYGIYFICEPTTTSKLEAGNDIGGASLATGNTITFGNATTCSNSYTRFATSEQAGITFRNGAGDNIQFNTITSNNLAYANHSAGIYGVNISNGTGGTSTGTYTTTISNNSVTLTNSSTTPITGIDFGYGISTGTIAASTNTITINQNPAAANTSAVTGIKASYTAAAITTNSNNITINQSTTGAGVTSSALVGIAIGGTTATNTSNGNAILINQTTSSTSAVTSAVTGISVNFSANSSTTLTIGATGVGNTITIKQAFTGSGTYGSGAIYYIDLGAGNSAAHGTVSIAANTFNTTGSTIRSTGALNVIGIGTGTIVTSVSLLNNIVNIDRVAATGAVSFFNAVSTSPNTPADIFTGNNITFTNLATSGALIVIQDLGGSTTGTKNFSSNTINVGGTMTGAVTGLSLAYGTLTVATNSITMTSASPTVIAITSNSSAATTAANNINGNTFSLSSSATLPNSMIAFTGAAGNYQVFNNIFTAMNFTGVMGSVPTMSGIVISAGSSNNIYSNEITNMSAGAAGTAVTATMDGILLSGGTSTNVYNNKIYGLTTAATSTPTAISGIRITGGTTNNIYNNAIGQMTAPASTTPDAIRGIYINNINSSTATNIVHNTIYLSATSSGTNFGSTGIYHTINATATTSALNMQNNIIINNSTPNGTGIVAAYRRSSTTLTNYASTSNNNLFYAGTPGTKNLIFYDGTNSLQTLAAFQAFTGIAPRETASVTENTGPLFTSLTGSNANFLRIPIGTSTYAESAAMTASTPALTVDYWGITRPFPSAVNGGTSKDIGASEFDGLGPVPVITLTSNTIGAGSVAQGATSYPIYSFNAAVTVNSATLTGFNITTTGSYATSDLTNLKLWYQATSTFNAGTATLLSTLTTATSPALSTAGTQTFPTFVTSATIPNNGNGYIYITADVQCTAALDNIAVNAITSSNVTFNRGTISGTPSAGNTQTITAVTPVCAGSQAASTASASSVVTWTAPAGCYSEVMIVVSPGTNSTTPTGNGSAYTANTVYASGTAFGSGYIVYKGTGTTATVTGLTNGTTYNVNFYTRNGTIWTSCTALTVTPAYCIGTFSTGCSSNDYINNFSINTLSNPGSLCNGNTNSYINYPSSSFTTSLTSGSSYTVSLTSGAGTGTHGAGVWFDFNNNGSFQDAGEFFLISNAIAASATASTSITIPSTAPAGTVRMRVRYIYSATVAQASDCSSNGYGETEDYTVTIAAPATPTITLNSNNIAAGNITQNVAAQPIYSFAISPTVASATLTGFNFTTTGSYATTDLTNLKLYYQTTSTFSVGSATLLSTLTTASSPALATFGAQTFPTFVTSPTISNGATGYLFITADLPCAATAGNTIAVNAVTGSNTTFVLGTATGTPSAGNTQTIIAATPICAGSQAASVASGQTVLTWTAPTGCYSEVMIVVSLGTNATTPSGNGSAYSANTVYSSGTAFGAGYVAYKGTGTTVTVTGLTNGATYNINFYTRNGTTWTSCTPLTVTPSVVYCVGTFSTGCSSNDYINNFSINTLSNAGSVCNGNTNSYINYPSSSFTTTLTAGSSYTAALTAGAGTGTHGAAVWFDFNGNGSFQDAGEFFLISNAIGASGSASTSITIPSTAPVGTVRMRVRYIYSVTVGQTNDCSANSYGETEDYTVTIAAPVTPTITLSTNNIASGNVGQGITSYPIYSFAIGATTASATLTGLNIVTSGSYATADLTNLKVWYQTSAQGATFTGGGTLLSTITTATTPALTTAGTQTFPTLTSQNIANGATGYIIITADVPCAATVGNTLAVNAVTASNTTFTLGTPTGTPAAGNTQTVSAAVPNNVTSPAASSLPTSSVLTWTAPTGCYSDVLIVVSPAANTGTPSGSGYLGASTVYGSGTAFGNGYIVYEGNTSSQTVTGLTVGNTYYVKYFTRNGTSWTAGVEIPVTPDYCKPVSSSSTYYISNFTTTGGIYNINNTSTYSGTGYGNYTGQSVLQAANAIVNFSSTFGGSGTFDFAIWVDWNNDGTFQTTERMFTESTQASSASGSFTVPVAQASGSYRMRVMADYYGVSHTDPCNFNSTGPYGEVEDYTFVVGTPCLSFSPSSTPSICTGGTGVAMTVSGGTAYTWSPSTGLSATTGSTVTANPTSTTTYTVVPTGTCTVPASFTVTVNTSPATPVMVPTSATICTGSIQAISVSNYAGNASPATVASGTVNVAIPDNSATGASTSVSVSGIPTAAVITGISVTYNITHTYDGDLSLALTAPNGNTLNLVNREGSTGVNYTNTVISSSSATLLSSGSAPFTGTFAADAGAAAPGATGFVPNVTAFSSLYGTPNGSWTFSARDNASSDVGTINNWTITITYTVASVTWNTNITNLYTNSGATTAYTNNTVATGVWAKPTATQTYTATATAANGCPSATSVVVNVNTVSTAPTAISGTTSICNDGTGTTLTANGTPGTGATYQWGTGSTVGTGPIGGATASTYSVTPTSSTTYWVSITGVTPCGSPAGGATQVVTVSQPSVAPTSITGTASVCSGAGTTLTANGTLGTGATYQWGTGSTVGTNPISGATSISYSVTPTSSTTYWVSITGAAPCGSPAGGATKAVTVTPNQWLGLTNDWNTNTNWCSNVVPTATTDVAIPTGVPYQPVIGPSSPQNAVCNNITINSGTSLTMSNGSNLTISAGAAFQNNGGTFTPGTGGVFFLGAGTINGSAATTFNNVTINTGAVTLTTVPTINGTLTINGGNLSQAPIYGPSSTLYYNVSYGRFVEWNASGVGTIGTTAGYPNNVTINTGTFDVYNSASGVARALNGILTVNSGATMNFNGMNAAFTAGGNVLVNGGTINMNTMSGSFTAANLQVFTTGSALNMNTMSQPMTFSGSVLNNGTLSLSTASGGDIYVAGNWTKGASATFNPNSRAVFMNGSGTQVVSVTGGGTETFNYFILQGSGTTQLSSSPATNVIVNSTGGLNLGSSNGTSTIDLNGQTLTLSGGGNLTVNSGNRYITSTIAGGTLKVTSSTVSVTSGGTLTFASTTKLQLQSGFNFGSGGITTINGTLQIDGGGFGTQPPTYGSTSTLNYNNGGSYTPPTNGEWNENIYSQPGVPYNVTLTTTGTVLDFSGRGFPHEMWGNLNIGSGTTLSLNSSNSGADFNIKGNWTNSGTFNPGTRLVQFNATSAQSLTGATTFDYVKMNNGGGLTLNNNITVNTVLDMTAGIIATGANVITLTNTASGALTNSSTSSYVYGNLWRYVTGSTAYTFPLGTATSYEPATLTLNSQAGMTYIKGSFTAGLPSTMPSPSTCKINNTPISDMLNAGYWTLTPDAYTTANYDITLNQRGYSTTVAGGANHLGVIKRHDASSAWSGTDVAGTNGYHSNANSSISGGVASAKRTGLTSFSDYGIGVSTGYALPVQLLFFTAEKNNNDGLLTWATASEINNDHFDIERSVDGVTFQKVGTVAGNGNSSQTISYAYTDANIVALNVPVIYYRLKQVDVDGVFEYSNIAAVDLAKGDDVFQITSVYPNPFADHFSLAYYAPAAQTIKVELYDVRGALVSEESVEAVSGLNVYTAGRLDHLASGFYTVNVNVGLKNYSYKIVKGE